MRQFIQVMRRWWSVVVAGSVIGLLVGWASAPGTAAVPTTFEATHTLILEPVAFGGTDINRAAVLATMGAVPERVAGRLGMDRELVRSMVSAGTRDNLGELLIIGRSTDPAQAEALANVTAEELVAEFGGSKAPFRRLELAVASPVETGEIVGPNSRAGRALLLGAFGLALGLGASFVIERLDNRIRSKPGAEQALGVPIVAEVPALPRDDRDRLLAAESSSFVEAYRRLRTSIDQRTTKTSTGDGHAVVMVVTSPTGGEGTTTTVAHLAAALGEIGRSVLVISGDLRHPRLHFYFDRAREPGLTDVLRGAPDTRRLVDLNLATKVRGVRFVASGQPVRNPSPLLQNVGALLREARSLGDFVLVDAPPLLTASETSDLATEADGVLLVVRAGRTSLGAAARSAELLERLGVPVVGAVLVGGDGYAGRNWRRRRIGRGARSAAALRS